MIYPHHRQQHIQLGELPREADTEICSPPDPPIRSPLGRPAVLRSLDDAICHKNWVRRIAKGRQCASDIKIRIVYKNFTQFIIGCASHH